MDRVAAAQGVEGAQLIGQFGVGFYSAFMVADRVDVISRRAGSEEATLWSSDGKGSYTMAVVEAAEAPARGTRVIVHLMEDAASFAERYTKPFDLFDPNRAGRMKLICEARLH